MNTQPSIGYCDYCGVLDHNLQAGLCPWCAAKASTYEPDTTVVVVSSVVRKVLAAEPHLTTAEIAERLGLPREPVQTRVCIMVFRGDVVCTGGGGLGSAPGERPRYALPGEAV